MTKAQFRKRFPYLLTWTNQGATVCSLRFETLGQAQSYAQRVFGDADYQISKAT